MSLNRYDMYPGKVIKLPKGQIMANVGSGLDVTMDTEYDEVRYDYNTNSYKTRSQQEEIIRLKKELEIKEKTRKEKLQSIIGYFYIRN